MRIGRPRPNMRSPCWRNPSLSRSSSRGLPYFPITGVIYLEVGAGRESLRRLHQSLNQGAVAFEEPFPYYPHSTLAQGLKPEQVQEVYELALRRWKEFAGPHRFLADHAVFVQNLNGKTWVDLATLWLGRVRSQIIRRLLSLSH